MDTSAEGAGGTGDPPEPERHEDAADADGYIGSVTPDFSSHSSSSESDATEELGVGDDEEQNGDNTPPPELDATEESISSGDDDNSNLLPSSPPPVALSSPSSLPPVASSSSPSSSSEPDATTAEKLYVLHLSQKNDDVMWTNIIPGRQVNFTQRGAHFLYCLLFCNSDNQVDMSWFDNFRHKITSSRARKETHIATFNKKMQNDSSLKSLTTWCKMQLQFLVESRLIFTAYNVANGNKAVSIREIIILAPAVQAFFQAPYNYSAFLKMNKTSKLFSLDANDNTLRLICEYIVFAFTASPTPINMNTMHAHCLNCILPIHIDKLHTLLMADIVVQMSAVCYADEQVALETALYCEVFFHSLTGNTAKDVYVLDKYPNSMLDNDWIAAFASSTHLTVAKDTLTNDATGQIELANLTARLDSDNKHPGDVVNVVYTNDGYPAFVNYTDYIGCITSLTLFKKTDLNPITAKSIFDIIASAHEVSKDNFVLGSMIQRMCKIKEDVTLKDMKTIEWFLVHPALQHTLLRAEASVNTSIFAFADLVDAINADRMFYV